jgi:hypothetical protein
MGKHKTTKNHLPVYSLNDYNSGDGMVTSVWGPSMWHTLHTMSFNYPVSPTHADKHKYRNYVLNLKYVLPCGKCRKNLRENFKKLPLHLKHMESRETFSRYLYDLHELINSMLGKKSGLTYEEVRERYEHFRSRCSISLKEIKPPKHTTRKKKEKGCTEPLYGEKSKCILKIIPFDDNESTFQIDQKCVKKVLE